MAIETQCEHCGFAYLSKDEMAGKRVRCRNCGQVFTIKPPNTDLSGSGAGQPDLPLDEPFNLPPIESAPQNYYNNDAAGETRQLPAISKFESNMTGGVGSAKSRMERIGDVDPVDFVSPQPTELNRPSIPFRFPYASDLDEWLPRIVPLLMLAWFFYSFWGWRPDPETADTYPDWAPLVPIALFLILFFAFWGPIHAGAIRKVSSALKFALPSNEGIRALCLASLPFGLGGVFWLAGESTATLIIGLFIGVAIAAPGAWFLYRLRQAEIAHAAIALAFATLLSAGLTIGVLYGANIALNKSLNAAGQGQLLAHSPMGPDMAWEQAAEPQPAAPIRRPLATSPAPTPSSTQQPAIVQADEPTPTLPRPTDVPQPNQANVQTPQDTPPAIPVAPPTAPDQAPAQAATDTNPFENHPVFEKGEYLPIEQRFLQVVYPMTPSNYIAVVSPGSDAITHDVRLYTISPFEEKARDQFASTVMSSGYALSPDGRLLVRITQFANTAELQVWDFRRSAIIARESMGNVGEEPRLVGFLDNTTVLCARRTTRLDMPPNVPHAAGSRIGAGAERDVV